MRAARAFWFLEYFGHPSVQLLDGGYNAWIAAGFDTTRTPLRRRRVSGRATRQEHTIATWREVRAAIGKPDAVILDTRSDAEYRGTAVRARRGGAIPGAVHIEWTRNLTSAGEFKSADGTCARCTSRPASRRNARS